MILIPTVTSCRPEVLPPRLYRFRLPRNILLILPVIFQTATPSGAAAHQKVAGSGYETMRIVLARLALSTLY